MWYTSAMVKKGIKVFVGMSGGVDSSVSALLLRDEGYEVTGVFIKVWQPEFVPCMAEDDRKDAMRVAANLGIPFITLNLENEYKRAVADYLIAEYAAGRTPNPDVMCNRHIKFGAFLRKAEKAGAAYIATGHYARITQKPDGYRLYAGVDGNKDQSYFLYTLGQSELSQTLFPVGMLTKPAVRRIAERAGLPTAHKKDSQGICFLGKLDMKEFLSHYIPSAEGAVLDESGAKIGSHDGAHYYTLGQRHGFYAVAASPHTSPYYVVDKDMEANTLTVSHTPSALGVSSQDLVITDARWTHTEPKTGKRYGARIRYRQSLLPVAVSGIDEGRAIIHYDAAVPLVSRGQSLVLYDGDECLGGGIIV